jgi:hypothetical protein
MAYMAPERQGYQVPGHESSHRYPNAVDMWALGEIAHKLLTKKHVFESPYALFQFTEHSEGFPDAHLRCSNIDTLASSFIQAAMTPSPGNRLTATDAQRHDWMLALLSPSLSVAVPSVGDTCNVPRKSFSVRKTPDKDTPSSSHLHPSDLSQHKLLSPPGSTNNTNWESKVPSRSTGLNEVDLQRLSERRTSSENLGNPPSTSRYTQPSASAQNFKATNGIIQEDVQISPRRVPESKSKSLGHMRRESIQARRAHREKANGVPQETDMELFRTPVETDRSPNIIKPVFLKGLLSVSTTSNKPLAYIQSDIIRVLDQLGVTYLQINHGFKCRHTPNIDLRKIVDFPNIADAPTNGHRQEISFGELNGGIHDRDNFGDQHRVPQTAKSARSRPDQSFLNAYDLDESEEREDRRSQARSVVARETIANVQSDLGGSMILVFEVLIVKVPLLQLHGIQFKKVDGGTWQYKSMAVTILDELQL